MILHSQNPIVSIKSENDDDYSDDSLFNITSYGADLSIREIITMYNERELLKPEMQRNYVWDKAEASRFIESILLGLPIPSIFFAKAKNNTKLIVDGYQRIMTVNDYIENKIFTPDGKVFKLLNTEKINKRWRGKTFDELSDEDQRQLRGYTIHTIIFEQKHPESDDSSMYQIFERINTSGRTLMPQEIRNCVYHGDFNTLLLSLNMDTNWRSLFGKQPDPRMRDMELILRFFALQKKHMPQTDVEQLSLKKHLNKFMNDHMVMTREDMTQYANEFTNVMEFIYIHFGKHVFHNLSNTAEIKFTEKFHPTIYDAITIATAFALRLRNGETLKKSIGLENARISLLQKQEFIEYISKRTTNIDHINGRIKLAAKVLYDLDYE